MTTRDIWLAILALTTPVLLLGSMALMMDPRTGQAGHPTGNVVMTVLPVAAPFLGFFFIARSFPQWRNRDRSSKALIVAMSCLYWLLYIPGLYVFWILFLIGRAGGI